MKKRILIPIILLSLVQGLYALSYSAHFSLYPGGGLTRIKDDDTIWTSYTFTAEVDALGLRAGGHTFSLPMSMTYFSDSGINGYYRILSHFDFNIALSYRYAFTDLFTLKAKGGIGYRYYDGIDASAASFIVALAAEFYPCEVTAITIPVEAFIAKDEIAISIGLGLLVRLGGGK